VRLGLVFVSAVCESQASQACDVPNRYPSASVDLGRESSLRKWAGLDLSTRYRTPQRLRRLLRLGYLLVGGRDVGVGLGDG
jgi:hypothetical protein